MESAASIILAVIVIILILSFSKTYNWFTTPSTTNYAKSYVVQQNANRCLYKFYLNGNATGQTFDIGDNVKIHVQGINKTPLRGTVIGYDKKGEDIYVNLNTAPDKECIPDATEIPIAPGDIMNLPRSEEAKKILCGHLSYAC